MKFTKIARNNNCSMGENKSDFNDVNFVYYFETFERFSFELEKIDMTLSDDVAIRVQHSIFVRCER